ncbi:unnamed protein product [Choristocarpus tenellus]
MFNVDLRGKNVIVTGANTGMGYVKAREMAKMGAKVTMACRSAERGKVALDKLRAEALKDPVDEGVPLRADITDVNVTVQVLDLGSFKSIIDFCQRFKASGDRIDILVNNAAVMAIPNRQETVDGLEMTVGVNHFGPHLLTRLLEPMMHDGGRIVFLSSLTHNRSPGEAKTFMSWDDINAEKPGAYSQWMSYGQSKLMNVFDAQEFSKRVAPRGINTYAVNPGIVNTDLMRHMTDTSFLSRLTRLLKPFHWFMFKTPLYGASTALKCALDPALGAAELSGKYWSDNKETEPSSLASDPANAPRMWNITEEITEAKLNKKIDMLLV